VIRRPWRNADQSRPWAEGSRRLAVAESPRPQRDRKMNFWIGRIAIYGHLIRHLKGELPYLSALRIISELVM
jgi:hypothetical protein